MNAFLKHVAKDIYEKYGNRLADKAIVFPNKRANWVSVTIFVGIKFNKTIFNGLIS